MRSPWRSTLPATVVVREGVPQRVATHVGAGTGIRLDVVLEDGTLRRVPQVEHWVPDRVVDGHTLGCATFEVPGDLPTGWHRLLATLDGTPLDPASTEATLVVTPQRLELPESVANGRVVGLMAQLYQVRSAGSWGFGDLRDLADLSTWAAEQHDADFVLINPLHAAEPVSPIEPSPYLPTTRRFASPLYLRVEDVPELAGLDPETRSKVAALSEQARALDTADRIDRDAVWSAKGAALRLVFAHGLTGSRAADFVEFCEREGEGLSTYATWWGPTRGGSATPSRAASPWGRPRTSSTSSARTGASPRGGRTGWPSSATHRSATWCARCCATPVASGSTTSSGSSGSGGSRRVARRPMAPT